MATTVTAYGKVKAKAKRGEAMPEGWMIDRQGKPLLDPKRADEGFLLPIGGHKGYGLALVVGILAGALGGAAVGSDGIGRATCRERVCPYGWISVVAVTLKKK